MEEDHINLYKGLHRFDTVNAYVDRTVSVTSHLRMLVRINTVDNIYCVLGENFSWIILLKL